jgi:hypothetical protein
VVALKAVLLAVADRRMAWTVVGLSSFFFSVFFFFTMFSSASLFFFCFSRFSTLSWWFCCCLVVMPMLVAVERKLGDNNCSFLSTAAPSLQFLAFSPPSLVFPSVNCSLFSLASSFGFCQLSSLVLLPSGGSAVVGSADGGGMAVVPGGVAAAW